MRLAWPDVDTLRPVVKDGQLCFHVMDEYFSSELYF